MAGMTEVGRLFNNNELIVAEVLQSAEAMKAAVNHLEQFMEKADTAARGKIVLATVKGDVHDIGKNLVEIILANNGYDVINLGIKVPPDELIEAWREHQPDAIGLSGLLVKSAQQMVTTGGDFKEHGVDVPLLVGGAALSETFTNTRIGPAYGAPHVLRQGRHDRPAHDERVDGPRQPRRRRSPTHTYHGRRAGGGDRCSAPRRRTRSQRRSHESAHRHSDSRRRRTSTASVRDVPQPAPRCGATSIRSCSTAATWDSRATSRSCWPSATPRRWNSSTTWRT